MSKIVMASNNRHKIVEIETFLKKLCPFDEKGNAFEYLSLADIHFTDDIVEDGDTFEENSLIKARTVAKLGYIGVADDSGLCVGCTGGKHRSVAITEALAAHIREQDGIVTVNHRDIMR